MHMIDTFIAKYLILLSVLIVGYFLLRLPASMRRRFLMEAMIGGVLTYALAKLGSKLYYNPRPFIVGHFTPYFMHANDNGFPSDHALLSSFLGFLVLTYNKTWGAALLLIAASIGIARAIAGVHHMIDIIGSFGFASIAMAIVYGMRVYMKKPSAAHPKA